MYRAGYTPRVIFYSQSSKGHEYDYGNPIVSITGKGSRHIPQNISAERKLFSNIKYHQLPNSKRTINPENEKENQEIKRLNKSKKYKWEKSTMDNTFSELEYKKYKPVIKLCDKKNKTSEELNLNKSAYNNKIEKNTYSFYIKNKYDYNSEIVNLPGGSKRMVNDIKDDYDKNKKDVISCNSTINCFRKRNLNNSKIDCLNHISKNNKVNYDNNKRQNIRNSILNLSKKELKTDNYYTNYNINAPTNEENNMSMKNNNKYAYDKKNKIRRKIIEVSKDNDDNYNNLNQQQIKQNGLYRNYVHDSFKYKNNNDLVTHYSRKRDMKSYNRLFNEVHQENSKYNLINYYGNNYSKKNYTQFDLV